MKTVIITGSTKGLGLEMARHLSQQNYRIVAIGRTATAGLNELIAGSAGQVSFEPFDLSELTKIHEFATMLIKKYDRPWGLINNAAVGYDGVLATQHESQIGQLIRLNVESPILLTKYLSRSMLVARQGRIVNISSIIATTGFSGLSVYAATKSALIGFTRSLAREIGKAGITVNAVLPGYMETDMTAGLEGEKLASIKRRSPLGKLAQPQDVAAVVAFLLGEQASSVTGTTITVDAGSTA